MAQFQRKLLEKNTGWIAAALAAMKHCAAPVVTASVDNVSFKAPIALGNILTLEAKITRAFQTSMEVHIEVWAEDVLSRVKTKSNEAFFTFVALSPDKKQSDPQSSTVKVRARPQVSISVD